MAEAPEALVARAAEARRAGDRESALRLYREAEAAFGQAAGRAHCLRHIGDLQRELGDHEAALRALEQAERLYRTEVADALALANTVRLLALLDGDPQRWREARALYESAQTEGLDLGPALAECDRHTTQ